MRACNIAQESVPNNEHRYTDPAASEIYSYLIHTLVKSDTHRLRKEDRRGKEENLTMLGRFLRD